MFGSQSERIFPLAPKQLLLSSLHAWNISWHHIPSGPLVDIQKAIENGPIEIVDDYPSIKWVDFSIELCNSLPEGTS